MPKKVSVKTGIERSGVIYHKCDNCDELNPDPFATHEDVPPEKYARRAWGSFTCKKCGELNYINVYRGKIQTIVSKNMEVEMYPNV